MFGNLWLDADEYAKFCHAIRVRFGNKIPANGYIFVGDYFYLFNYNNFDEYIYCTMRINIDGNEDTIKAIIGGVK